MAGLSIPRNPGSGRAGQIVRGEPQLVGGWMELTSRLDIPQGREEALIAVLKAVELDPEDAITRLLHEQAAATTN